MRSAAERLGYVPNPLAQALARGLGTRIVVAVSGSAQALNEDPYLGRVISAMAEMCTREGVGVSLQWLPFGAAAPLDRLAGDRSVRGVVLINTTEQLLASVPRALYGRVASIGIGSPQVPSFDVDNGGGAAAVVRHLHVIGRRRIAMVTGAAWLPCSQRPVDAYRAVMAEAGLPVRIVPGDFTAERGMPGPWRRCASGRTRMRSSPSATPLRSGCWPLCGDSACRCLVTSPWPVSTTFPSPRSVRPR